MKLKDLVIEFVIWTVILQILGQIACFFLGRKSPLFLAAMLFVAEVIYAAVLGTVKFIVVSKGRVGCFLMFVLVLLAIAIWAWVAGAW